jgi:hypothetical protein
MSVFKSRMPELIRALKNPALLNKIALGAEFIIKQRTQKGLDVFQQQFIEYSKRYSRIRERANLPVNKVDLYFDHTQGMLTKIDHVVAANFETVEIFINDPAKELIGGYHNTSGAGKSRVIRKWWGIQSEAEKKKLSKIGFDVLKAIIKDI